MEIQSSTPIGKAGIIGELLNRNSGTSKGRCVQTKQNISFNSKLCTGAMSKT